MKYRGTLISVSDMEGSKSFYREILGLRVTADFGANVSLTGGLFLQTRDSWSGFIGGRAVTSGSNCGELYFEEEDFDGFINKLNKSRVSYVHEVQEQPWGQRAVRFFDPDGHIIEVAEPLAAVVLRFRGQGMSVKQIAKKMDIPEKMTERYLK